MVRGSVARNFERLKPASALKLLLTRLSGTGAHFAFSKTSSLGCASLAFLPPPSILRFPSPLPHRSYLLRPLRPPATPNRPPEPLKLCRVDSSRGELHRLKGKRVDCLAGTGCVFDRSRLSRPQLRPFKYPLSEETRQVDQRARAEPHQYYFLLLLFLPLHPFPDPFLLLSPRRAVQCICTSETAKYSLPTCRPTLYGAAAPRQPARQRLRKG